VVDLKLPGCGRALLTALLVGGTLAGCGRPPPGTTDPEAKLRLERLLEAYKLYVAQKRKGPPGEAALRDFIQALPAEQKSALKVESDPGVLFTSPRDGQKYEVRYGLTLSGAGATEAVAWEQTGQGGMRYVALNVGYVQQYSDADFRELKKK
jgi:hypothetical protein